MNLNTFTLGDELKPLTNHVESLRGYPEPKRKWSARVEKPVRKAELRLKCPKCGGESQCDTVRIGETPLHARVLR